MRTLARLRRRVGPALLLLPALGVVAADAAMRGGRLVDFPVKYVGSYLGSLLESAVLWGVLLLAASARAGALRWAGAGAFVLLATVALGGQVYFYRSYATYLNLDATLFGTSMADSLFGQLSADGSHFLVSVAPVALAAAALVWLARAWLRPRRKHARIAALASPAALAGALLLPCSYRAIQGSTPDVIYFHAIGGLAKQLTGISEERQVRPGRREPPRLPALAARPARARNVLFVLTESVRADAACSEARADCPAAPFTNALFPKRFPLRQMRSNSSTTAIQLAVLWSGLEPTAGREALHRAPTVFDFAHAAGVRTAYWTSHHMMFANSRLWVQDLPLDAHCSATTLDPLADIDTGARDALLSERAIAELPGLAEPFFAVVHYGNTHVPYLVAAGDQPFQPAAASKDPADNDAYRRYYQNAVYQQDRAIAALLAFVRAQPFGERTVVLYTSDHGEQFREHDQLGHTGSLFDVEIHVPTWVAAPGATLADEERAALARHADAPSFHTDVAPTLLDLLGLWDAPELRAFRAAMPGASLLRAERPDSLLALSNCSGVWGCAFQNWGVMRGFRKLAAREWDADWGCFDVAADPEEKRSLPLEHCADLLERARTLYPGLPGR